MIRPYGRGRGRTGEAESGGTGGVGDLRVRRPRLAGRPFHAAAAHWIELQRDVVVAPLGGAIVAALLAEPGEWVRSALLAGSALAIGACLARRVNVQAALLPLMRHVFPLLGPLLGAVFAQVVGLVTDAPEVSPLELLAVVAARPSSPSRGPASSARDRRAPGGRRSSDRHGRRPFRHRRWPREGRTSSGSSAASATPATAAASSRPVQYRRWGHEAGSTGSSSSIASIPRAGRRGAATDRLRARSRSPACTSPSGSWSSRRAVRGGLRARAHGEINAAWFQCLADPTTARPRPPLKRVPRRRVRGCVALVLPLLAVLASCSGPRDGGPGSSAGAHRRGRAPVPAHKLRTMRRARRAAAQWAAPTTRASPARQLPAPHASRRAAAARQRAARRHEPRRPAARAAGVRRPPRADAPVLPAPPPLKPGITGWAQIRCGYAGSDVGSAWKLCHDLYYLKHRSVGLDPLILAETLATLFFDRSRCCNPRTSPFC